MTAREQPAAQSTNGGGKLKTSREMEQQPQQRGRNKKSQAKKSPYHRRQAIDPRSEEQEGRCFPTGKLFIDTSSSDQTPGKDGEDGSSDPHAATLRALY